MLTTFSGAALGAAPLGWPCLAPPFVSFFCVCQDGDGDGKNNEAGSSGQQGGDEGEQDGRCRKADGQ